MIRQNLSLETKITGSFSTRYFMELFGNTIHFPVANLLLELLIEKPIDYLLGPDPYILLIGSFVQAYFLTYWQNKQNPRRFWGNLIGPALYTLVEGNIEGLRFFLASHHLAYWGYSIVIGALQSLRLKLPAVFNNTIIVIENVTRTSILFLMYTIFEALSNPTQTTTLKDFFGDASHRFIGLAVLFLGFIIGFANLTAERYLTLLKETSSRLKKYSEWLLGRDLLAKTFDNPSALSLTRQERTVMFMDIRGFTQWSEKQSPENVVNLLTKFYQIAESSLTQHSAIKFKLSADEVMAVFSTAESAVQAALELRSQVSHLLSSENIGVGIGLDCGLLVEGLLGSSGVKFYDVIGDTVNTAKRVESAAKSGEVLISDNVYNKVEQTVNVSTKHEISVKGKAKPILVYSVEDIGHNDLLLK